MKMIRQPSPAPGFVHVRECCVEPLDLPPAELLQRTSEREGTWRFATPNGRDVFLLGEVREGGTTGEVSEDLIDAGLEEMGLTWKRRDAQWQVSPGARCPQEVLVSEARGEVRVEATLTNWDVLGPEERAALELFLCRAQAGLRFARCEWAGDRAIVAGRLATRDVEAGLRHVLAGVLAGARALAREASALTIPELARVYLQFQTKADEILTRSNRI